MKNDPVKLERVFNAPTDKVWKAITDAGEMKHWYFDLPGFKPEPGYEFQFSGGKDPEHPYIHLCKITDIVAGEKLTYSWQYKGFEGISHVTFELFPQGEKTKLVLTHEGLSSFPANNPDLDRENFVLGWNDIINRSLKDYLEK
jgi:uncharacterized protein YndB with AHSA1/START domain